MEQEGLMIFQGIISLIVLIVFFFMASNLSKLKKHFLKSAENDLKKEIDLLVFKGKNKEAIDRYYDLAYIYLKKDGYSLNEKKSDLKRISVEITNLGGEISEPMKKYIK